MKRSTSRLLSALLVLCMVLALMPGTALAATSGKCGDNLTWSLSEGTLTISGTGDMENYRDNNPYPPWYFDEFYIHTIRIDYGATSIGEDAFDNFRSLTSVAIPNSVTTIGKGAFSFCSSLTSVTIPDSVTIIEQTVFMGCSNLASVTIPNGVTSIGSAAFKMCGLTSVTIPNSVTNIGYEAFSNCSSLTSVTIPSSVTSIGGRAFENCISLTDVYYGGSESQWEQIAIDGYNDSLLNANIHYGKTASSTPEQNLIAYKPQYSLSDSYKSDKYYWQMQGVELTGNMAQDFVNIAKSQVGYHEGSRSGDFSGVSTGSANYTEYGRYVNNANGAWCGFFAYWCIHAAGATNSIFPERATSASVTPYTTFCDVYTWKNLVDGRVTPQAGDLVIFKSTSSSGISQGSSLTGGSHIEIVYGYKYDGSASKPYIFQTYGGNTGNGVVVNRAKLSCGTNGNTGWGGNLEYIYAIVRPNWNVYAGSAGKTVMTFHCPIDIEISYNGTSLSTVNNQLTADFGTLTYNEKEDYYTATLDYNPDYQVVVTGKDAGVMDMTIAYYDETNDLISQAAFNNVGITTNGIITTSPLMAEKGVELYVCDESGDFVEAWRCEPDGCAENMDAELTEYYLNPTVPVEAPGGNTFTDVSEGEYYYDAVQWAVENNITSGTSSTTFSPNDPCTRAQIVTFLYRSVGSPAVTSTSKFTDVSSSAYYADAVAWAVAKGVTSGTSATTFSPNDPCTRAQIVTFLWRAAGKPTVTSGSSFTDVPSGSYYADAVAWAVKNGVTSGTGTNTFSPDDVCTRSQGVTFLYRCRDMDLTKGANDSSSDYTKYLAAMPYYVDVAACKMTAQQALAYAQLLEDGIAGKVVEPQDHYDSSTSGGPLYWDRSYTVSGYDGEYLTNRAGVILGDFAQDGNPYLCVMSTITKGCGFDVYYGTNGTVNYVLGEEAYNGRARASYSVDSTGKLTVEFDGSSSAFDYYYTLYEVKDGRRVQIYEADYYADTLPAGVTLSPCTLRDMINYLRQYAAAKQS